MAKKNNQSIKLFALGGLGCVGMNCYCFEYRNEIIVMDAGILFANDEAPGVDYIIPNFTYLVENQNKIKALFITHGHEDHIGSLPFLLSKVKIPCIYANGIAYNLIRNKMYEYPNIEYNLKKFQEDQVIKYNNFEISFFRTNHSIPDSFGIAIKTNMGYVVNTGDFKFDLTPVGKCCDYYKMSKLGNEGVLCLMADSTNADVLNFSMSEKKIAENIRLCFKQAKSRIICATFASNVFRVQQILQASVECNRKVAVFGHSMEKNIEAAMRLKYINVPKDLFISQRDINKYPAETITILCTGSQGEPLAALSRMANGTHKQIKLLPNDTIIYSSKPIPGNEQYINRNINALIKNKATVIRNTPLTGTHTTGHASQDEMRLMLNLMKPKYFMPVHGEYNMLKRHANLAVELGIPSKNCFCLDNGDLLEMDDKSCKVIKNAIPHEEIYLDSNLSDVNNCILKERKHLSEEGLISLVFTVNKKYELICPVKFKSAGFLDVKASKEVIDNITFKATQIFNKFVYKVKKINKNYLRIRVSQELSQYIYEYIEKKPFIIININVL